MRKFMYLKTLNDIFRYNFQRIVLLAVATIITGCSSGTQRFFDGFYEGEASTQLTENTAMSSDRRIISQSSVIQSDELPPVEPLYSSGDHNHASYNFSGQEAGLSFRENRVSPDGRIMGAPPKNLGTLSRSNVNNSSVFQRGSYIVQSRDTLSSIARQKGISVEALKVANGMGDNAIYIGQKLVIPDKQTVVTSNAQNNAVGSSTTTSSAQSKGVSSVKTEKISSASRSVNTAPAATINTSDIKKNVSKQMTTSKSANNLSKTVKDLDNVTVPQATGISKMRWPVRGRLLSHFGQKKGTITNRGIDINVPEGSSVKAAENGVIIYASDGLKELGNVVMIRHEDNIITIYGHNSKLTVSRGQRVKRGDEIAKSGISGDATTPRVYFEIRQNSIPVDPAQYLEN
ncbi:hypothetical protein H710_00630 [Bartonella bacilliformis Ver097]|uniref:LysM domain-containing protein n=2 Tax=Bartonella bacilliformis TaxID=774 RepID=A0A072REV5_BARBA|nr:hypothetical protein H710_00630 [Bartonella bacilliformis Ver097]